jgi:putative ABC transport system permease protein
MSRGVRGTFHPAHGTTARRKELEFMDRHVVRGLLRAQAMLHDLRMAARGLWRAPGLSVVVVLTLAVAIGANTAIFTVVNGVLLRPLPYPQPDALVRIHTAFHSIEQQRYPLSTSELVELRRDARSFASTAGWIVGTATFGEIDRPARVAAAYATPELLETLGVRPARGRFYRADEARPREDPRVVVIGHDLWQRAFGADRRIVGRAVNVDGISMTVIGVMPPGFTFPDDDVEAWLPYGVDTSDALARGNHFVNVVGRLAPGVSLDAARAELAALTTAWGRLDSPTWHAVDPAEHPMIVNPLREELVGAAKAPLWLLQAAVLFVLLIACANVSNLFLGRAEARAREIAVRVALGAGRGRLVRLFLAEAALLAAAATALGLFLAVWGVELAAALSPAGAPRVGELGLDGRVLAFAMGCAIVATVIPALAPLWHTRGVDLGAGLKEGARGSAGRSRLRRAIVAVEVAVAIVLAIGCGLTLQSFARLSRVDVGFRPEGLLTFELEVPAARYRDAPAALAFWERLQRELAAVPGVERVTLANGLPPAHRLATSVVWFDGAAPWNQKGAPVVDYWSVVGDDYFETLGLRLVAGRALRRGDHAAVVVNETLARSFFPGKDPVGQTINLSPWREGVPLQTIVGVVADVKQQGLARPSGIEAYVPMTFVPRLWRDNAPLTMTVALRGERPAALAGAVETAVRALDPALPLSKVRTMDAILWEAVARPRFVTVLLTIFGALALGLAVLGVYGVVSIAVTQRTRELGIRMALGARSGGIQRLVLRQGMLPVLVGIAGGLVATFGLNLALARVLGGVLYETRPLDPTTFALVSALVAVVAASACLVPARRATRVDPMVALRSE